MLRYRDDVFSYLKKVIQYCEFFFQDQFQLSDLLPEPPHDSKDAHQFSKQARAIVREYYTHLNQLRNTLTVALMVAYANQVYLSDQINLESNRLTTHEKSELLTLLQREEQKLQFHVITLRRKQAALNAHQIYLNYYVMKYLVLANIHFLDNDLSRAQERVDKTELSLNSVIQFLIAHYGPPTLPEDYLHHLDVYHQDTSLLLDLAAQRISNILLKIDIYTTKLPSIDIDSKTKNNYRENMRLLREESCTVQLSIQAAMTKQIQLRYRIKLIELEMAIRELFQIYESLVCKFDLFCDETNPDITIIEEDILEIEPEQYSQSYMSFPALLDYYQSTLGGYHTEAAKLLDTLTAAFIRLKLIIAKTSIEINLLESTANHCIQYLAQRNLQLSILRCWHIIFDELLQALNARINAFLEIKAALRSKLEHFDMLVNVAIKFLQERIMNRDYSKENALAIIKTIPEEVLACYIDEFIHADPKQAEYIQKTDVFIKPYLPAAALFRVASTNCTATLFASHSTSSTAGPATSSTTSCSAAFNFGKKT